MCNWTLVKYDFLTCMSILDLSKKYRISVKSIHNKKSTDNWLQEKKEILNNFGNTEQIINELSQDQKNSAKQFAYTIQDSFQNFEAIRQAALAAKNYNSAIKAEENKAKFLGFYELDNLQQQKTFTIEVIHTNEL